MKVYADQTTGELVEHLPTEMVGLQPYDFREAKAAHMRQSVERRRLVDAYTQAILELGAAERAYRSTLSQEILTAKEEHGATVAEAVAKGTQRVAEARERYTVADGLRYAALERIRTSDGDLTGISQLVKWSQAVATGPWGGE